MPDRLPVDHAVKFVLDSLEAAHTREKFVGGFFNAYEPAIHYELFSAALVYGMHDAGQEVSLGKGQTTCDLVFPLEGGRLWLEVKCWWFLSEAYGYDYFMQSKTLEWPVQDWSRLPHGSGDHRAVLLLRAWDTERGQDTADRWLDNITETMRNESAPPPVTRKLRSHAYLGTRKHTRSGDAVLWSSTPSNFLQL